MWSQYNQRVFINEAVSSYSTSQLSQGLCVLRWEQYCLQQPYTLLIVLCLWLYGMPLDVKLLSGCCVIKFWLLQPAAVNVMTRLLFLAVAYVTHPASLLHSLPFDFPSNILTQPHKIISSLFSVRRKWLVIWIVFNKTDKDTRSEKGAEKQKTRPLFELYFTFPYLMLCFILLTLFPHFSCVVGKVSDLLGNS